MADLLARIEWVLKSRKGLIPSARAWCERAELSPNYLGTLRTRANQGKSVGLTVESARALAQAAQVRFEWLSFGEGSPDIEDMAVGDATPEGEFARRVGEAARQWAEAQAMPMGSSDQDKLDLYSGRWERLSDAERSAAVSLRAAPAPAAKPAPRLAPAAKPAAALPPARNIIVELDADNEPLPAGKRLFIERVPAPLRDEAEAWAANNFLAAMGADDWDAERWARELLLSWQSDRKGLTRVAVDDVKARGDALRARARKAGMPGQGEE